MKKVTIAAAVSAVIGLGAAGQAAASVYGGSKLELQNLNVLFTEDGTNPTAAATINSFTFTNTNTAALNGSSDLSPGLSVTCGGVPTPGVNTCTALPGKALNALAANAPGGVPVRADGNFALFGPGANQYSNSDSEITTAQLVGATATLTKQIAESELQGGLNAAANAEIQSSTGFTFDFSITGGTDLDMILTFEADPYLMAEIIQAPAVDFLNGNAQANMNASFSLTSASGDEVTWSPQGTVANDCSVDPGLAAVTCAELLDGEDLNRNLSVSTDPSSVNYSLAVGFSSYGIQVAGLTGGDYTLAFNSVTSTSLRQAIPEPGMLALLGAGLLGLGVARRRKA